MTDIVSFAVRDGVATLTMDDGKANALSLAMSQALDAGLDRAVKEAKVVVIRGRPGVLWVVSQFKNSAGLTLEEISGLLSYVLSDKHKLWRQLWFITEHGRHVDQSD